MTKKTATATLERDPESQITIKLTDEIYLDEWKLSFALGQEVTVRASLLSDPRFVGKFEEL